MKKNMGAVDRAIRIVVAAGIVILLVTNILSGTLGIILGILAVVFLLTSTVGFCPLYFPFTFSTCKDSGAR